MRFCSRDELRDLMNGCGRRRQPFVWGIDYAGVNCFFIDDISERGDVLWSVRGKSNAGDAVPSAVPSLTVTGALSCEEYSRMFATVREGLMRGDSFLANLTVATGVECTATLRDVFLHSRAPYRLLIGNDFVCFSPEPFVRIEGRKISTFPMKGTADASVAGAERRLLDDVKETCEHFTIVDLMRNDLGSVAEGVKVERFRYVERIATAKGDILQTSSEICGTIPAGLERDFGDLLLPLLPAGSITGAPKPATVSLIQRAEKVARGWYTGVFGYFDGRVMDTAVMIRCLQRGADGRLYFHSGGGITAKSVCCDEYEEMLAKVYLTK